MLNPSDANRGVDFAFAEFTLDGAQLYANVSFVDFVPRLPIALALSTRSGGHRQQTVAGMPPDGAERLAAGLRAQAAADGWPWDRLVVAEGGSGRVLRVLSPAHGDAVGASFGGYFEGYVEEVMRRYDGRSRGAWRLRIDTQGAGPGVVEGYADTARGALVLGGGAEAFAKPTTRDILGCNSGPFATGASPLRNAVIPRLAAAFARSALLEADLHPSHPHTFYGGRDRGRGRGGPPTNHYARLVHECLPDGKGYAFPYDDVQPSGGGDQSGKVNAGDPVLLTVGVGGAYACAGAGAQAAGWGAPVPYTMARPVYGAPAAPPEGGLRDKVRDLKGKIFR